MRRQRRSRADPWQRGQRFRRLPRLHIKQQLLRQRRTRIGCFLGVFRQRRPWQQHPRLDFGERRRHQQILRCQRHIELLHHLQIGEVLLGNQRHRNIQHIKILFANQIDEHIQRPGKRLQQYPQRIRRNKQILRQLHHRLAEHQYLLLHPAPDFASDNLRKRRALYASSRTKTPSKHHPVADGVFHAISHGIACVRPLQSPPL